MNVLDLLYSRPALLRGTLKHQFIENMLLRTSQRAARKHFAQTALVEEMKGLTAEFLSGVVDGYDPRMLARDLPTLLDLDPNVRQQLIDMLGAAYQREFEPDARHLTLTHAADNLWQAFDAWRVSDPGFDAATEWSELQATAKTLHQLLTALPPTRWIP